jgi:dephospho-CoA kinase
MKTLIAFAGKAGAGKSTAANFLQEEYGFKILSFATPLKQIQSSVQTLFNFPLEKDRKLLQFLGQYARTTSSRHNLPDFVLIKMLEAIEQCNGEFIVVDDLRMITEYNLLKSMGFVCVRVVGRRYMADEMNGGFTNHLTEIDLDNEEMQEVMNDSDLHSFKKIVLNLV